MRDFSLVCSVPEHQPTAHPHIQSHPVNWHFFCFCSPLFRQQVYSNVLYRFYFCFVVWSRYTLDISMYVTQCARHSFNDDRERKINKLRTARTREHTATEYALLFVFVFNVKLETAVSSRRFITLLYVWVVGILNHRTIHRWCTCTASIATTIGNLFILFFWLYTIWVNWIDRETLLKCLSTWRRICDVM